MPCSHILDALCFLRVQKTPAAFNRTNIVNMLNSKTASSDGFVLALQIVYPCRISCGYKRAVS